MGLETIHPKPDVSKPEAGKQKYPYLLKGKHIAGPNEAWAIDITYIPLAKGFMYLGAVMDLYSRYVVNWSLSNTMEADWIVQMVKEAIEKHGVPQILNCDPGSQFTSEDYIGLLKGHNIQISMDGKGRDTDNIFIERLSRNLKYEYEYLHPVGEGLELYQGLHQWFSFYNDERHHQTLGLSKANSIVSASCIELSTYPREFTKEKRSKKRKGNNSSSNNIKSSLKKHWSCPTDRVY